MRHTTARGRMPGDHAHAEQAGVGSQCEHVHAHAHHLPALPPCFSSHSYFYGPSEQWDFFYAVRDQVRECPAGCALPSAVWLPWMWLLLELAQQLGCMLRPTDPVPAPPPITHVQWGNKWAMQTTHENITTEAEFDELLAQVGAPHYCALCASGVPVCMATCNQRRRQVGILQTPYCTYTRP